MYCLGKVPKHPDRGRNDFPQKWGVVDPIDHFWGVWSHFMNIWGEVFESYSHKSDYNDDDVNDDENPK